MKLLARHNGSVTWEVWTLLKGHNRLALDAQFSEVVWQEFYDELLLLPETLENRLCGVWWYVPQLNAYREEKCGF